MPLTAAEQALANMGEVLTETRRKRNRELRRTGKGAGNAPEMGPHPSGFQSQWAGGAMVPARYASEIEGLSSPTTSAQVTNRATPSLIATI